MRETARALEFMVRLTLERNAPEHLREIRLGARRPRRTRVYEPPSTAVGTLLFIHGMSVRGFDDSRVIALGRALSSVGFRVVVPHFADIQDLRIDARQVDEIADCVHWLGADRELCPAGRLGLIAPSFSGGLALVASSRPIAIPYIAAVCSIGGYSHVDQALDFLLNTPGIDEYGMLVLLWNFGPVVLGKKPALMRALKEAALDNGFRRSAEEARAPALVQALTPADRKLYRQMLTSAPYRMKLWQKLKTNRRLSALAHALAPADHLDRIVAPVSIIHGDKDDVIPPSESEFLFHELRRRGRDVRLCLTPFLSHGDAGLRFSMVKEAYDLAAAFGFFFQKVVDAKVH